MRVALINPEYPSPSGLDHGGIATFIYCLANALADAGHRVHILARNGTTPDPLRPGVRMHHFGFRPARSLPGLLDRLRGSDIAWERGCSRAARECLETIHREEGLDIIEAAEYGGLASELRSPLPAPVIVHFHTPSALVDELNHAPRTARRRRVYRYECNALRNAAAFKCNSTSLTVQLQRCCGIEASRIQVIRTPVPTDEFDAIAKKSADPDRIDILFAGRFERRKGAESIVHSINEILALDRRIHFTIAGETDLGEAGEHRHAVERVLKAPFRSRVWFVGPVSRRELLLLYRRSSLFLMPSLFENAPNTLYEAMASRLPVVGAAAGGIAETIVDNETGLLFDPADTSQLVAAVARLIRDQELAAHIADKAYNTITTCHDPARIANETAAWYRTVIDGGAL
jgi:glycosyltransferase involved in cell wall biosynthesis